MIIFGIAVLWNVFKAAVLHHFPFDGVLMKCFYDQSWFWLCWVMFSLGLFADLRPPAGPAGFGSCQSPQEACL